VQLRAALALNCTNFFAERQQRKHVVFQVCNDSATQQAQRFRIQKRVAGQQPPEAIPDGWKDCFCKISYTHWLAVTKFGTSAPKTSPL